MKKIIAILLFVISFITLGCVDQNNGKVETTFELLTSEEIKNISRQHNESLDYVLKVLKTKDISKVNNVKEMINILNEGTRSYFVTILDDQNLINQAVDLSEKEIIKKLMNSSQTELFKSENFSPIRLVVEENYDLLSEDQIKYLFDLDVKMSMFNGQNVNTLVNSLEEIKTLLYLN